MNFGPLLRASVRRAGAFLLVLLLGLGALQAAPQVLGPGQRIDRQGPPSDQGQPGPAEHWQQTRFERRGGEREAAALWLPSPCGVQSVNLNGVGLLHDERGLSCRSPQLMALPIGLLNDKGNVLELRLSDRQPLPFSLLRHAQLAAPEVGAWDEMLARHMAGLSRQATLALGSAGLMLGLALTLALLAITHHWERRLMLVSATLLSWALVLAAEWQDAAAGLGSSESVRGLLLSLCCASWLLVMARQIGWRLRGLDLIATVAAVALPLVTQWQNTRFLPAQMQAAVLWFWALALSAVGLAFVAHRLRSWWRSSHRKRQLLEQLEFTLTPALICAGLVNCLLAWSLGHAAPAMALVSVGLGVLSASLLLGYARMRLNAEQRVTINDQRWQDRLQEVERHQKALSEQHLEQVTERERKRIAADLHDDLGAKLLTIVHTSESERISTLAREALEEMRLSVRGLTGKPVQLLDAVGDWRAEVVSRLTQANIEAEWVSLAEDVSYTLPARAYVQTTRVIREAISNIIKHSGATRCVVRCQVVEDDFQVILQDNGQGIPSALDGRLDKGHGMASMKARAKQMQGQCLVESGPGWGTLIRLSIPL